MAYISDGKGSDYMVVQARDYNKPAIMTNVLVLDPYHDKLDAKALDYYCAQLQPCENKAEVEQFNERVKKHWQSVSEVENG